ncbi:MAG: DUF6048 family protein [Bacteroidota bacterium]|nr:DUF6048 family protein [Bacteroidota bacterium]
MNSPTKAWAQDTIPSSTVSVPVDTAKVVLIPPDLDLPDELPVKPMVAKTEVLLIKSKLFSGIEIGIDYLKFLGLLVDFETKYEGSIGLIFKDRFIVNFEGGMATLSPQQPFKNATNYISQGKYGRIGLNYIIASGEKTNFTAGLRYGFSNFNEDIEYSIINYLGFFGIEKVERKNLSAEWYEIIVLTESKIFADFYAGAILRFRILAKIDEPAPIPTHSIPGYGRGFDKTIPALNLYFKYRLNF